MDLTCSFEEFGVLADLLPDIVWTARPDGGVDYFNRRWSEYTGMSREKSYGAAWMTVLHPEDRANCLEPWRVAFGTGAPLEIACRLKRAADGAYRWHLVRAGPVRALDGRVVRWVGASTDIDDQRKAEEVLERQAQALREKAQLVDLASDGIVVRDLQGVITFWNRGAEQLYGYTRHEAFGKAITVLLKTQFQQPCGEIEAELLRMGRWQGSVIQYRKDGAPLVVESHWALQFDNRAQPKAVLEINSDVTERRHAEARLRSSEQRMRAILDLAHEAFIAVDLEGRIIDWNRQAESTFGWSRAEAAGKLLSEVLVREQDRPAYLRIIEEFRATGQTGFLNQRLELTVDHRNGEEIPVEVTVSSIPLGTSSFFSAFLRDITSRKQATEALARTTSELKRSNQELEVFAYVASHDLQEPLRTVASYTQLLVRDYSTQLDDGDRKLLEVVMEGTRRMQTLINDLLAYSRLATRAEGPGMVDCNAIVKTVLSNLAVATRDAGATVDTGPLPVLRGDESQLTQLFQNLISNALKFHGPEPPRLEIGAKLIGSEWQFSVRDNGIGIDPKFHERVFVIFQRLHRRDKYPGTGIGLAICKRIVEHHGGRIWVESAPGRGATFYFTIPEAVPGAATGRT